MTDHVHQDERYDRPRGGNGFLIGAVVVLGLIVLVGGGIWAMNAFASGNTTRDEVQTTALQGECAALTDARLRYNCILAEASEARAALPADQRPSGAFVTAVQHVSVRNQPCEAAMSHCFEWTSSYDEDYARAVVTYVGRRAHGVTSAIPQGFVWAHGTGAFPASACNPMPQSGEICWWANSAYRRP